MECFNIEDVKIKNIGNSISSRLNEKFKSVFRILFASLDQLACWNEYMSTFPIFRAC